ncbi:MAG TPA: hypothetical protein VG736_01115 [Vicinamibacterales bacterium]|nr:hypothetical protein [Vicinamibacterales bacterium]
MIVMSVVRVLVFCSFASMAAVLAAQRPSQTSPRDFRPETIAHVSAFSDLEPRSAAERALAAFFADDFPPIDKPLPPGVTVVPPEHTPPQLVPFPFGPPPSPEGRFRRWLCNYPTAAVIGRAVDEHLILNRTRSALVTVVRIDVTRWLRPMTGGTSIAVAAKGGRVFVGDKIFTTPPAIPFAIDQTAVFFLEKFSDPATFTVSDSSDVINDKVSFPPYSGAVADVTSKMMTIWNACNESDRQ